MIQVSLSSSSRVAPWQELPSRAQLWGNSFLSPSLRLFREIVPIQVQEKDWEGVFEDYTQEFMEEFIFIAWQKMIELEKSWKSTRNTQGHGHVLFHLLYKLWEIFHVSMKSNQVIFSQVKETFALQRPWSRVLETRFALVYLIILLFLKNKAVGL